uniref:Protein krueppel n=1 Tax=Anopheles merus TaxID=30066 RepID=A0A2Y9D340_ANOME
MNNDCVDLRLNFEKLCRFCLSLENCVPLFINSTINEILIDAVDVLLPKVDEHDGLPNCVCARCHQRMVDFSKFEATALEVYNKLQSVIAYLDEEGDDCNAGPQPMLEDDANERLKTSPNAIEDGPAQEMESIAPEAEIAAPKTHPASKPTRRPKKACPVCGKLVSQISKHMPVHSSATKRFACEQCDKRFAQLASLRKHLKIHRNIRNYRCEHCGDSFCDRSSLRYHLAKHRGVPGFACEFCDRQFYTSSQWKQHQSLAHRERTFRCDVCGQAFLLKHHLTEHAQLHTDGRPHECDVCGKAFKRERYLHVHKRRRHSMKEEGGE